MPLSTRSRARRPAIAPILTGNNNELPERSWLQSRRLSSPYLKAVRSETPVSPRHIPPKSPNPEVHHYEEVRPTHREVLRQLEALNVASPVGHLTTPLGTSWTVAGIHPPTPVTAVAAQPCLIIPIIEVRASQKQNRKPNFTAPRTPTVRGSPRWLVPTRLPGRRQSAPCCGSTIRQANFQKFREDLWKRGAKMFGHSQDADVFVRPLQLPRSSEGPYNDDDVSPLSSPSRGCLTVRAVIRSKGTAVGLKRQFDMEKLRATLPEPFSPPHSPNFNREALLSVLKATIENSPDVTLSPPLGSERQDFSCDEIKVETDMKSQSSILHSPDVITIPIHTPYARAQLPALAAIMMSDKVRRGDTIDLPVPHPGAWSETIAYVYTGEEELLTGLVRENILYLGGRV